MLHSELRAFNFRNYERVERIVIYVWFGESNSRLSVNDKRWLGGAARRDGAFEMFKNEENTFGPLLGNVTDLLLMLRIY